MKRHRWARTRVTDEGYRLRSCRDCPAVVRWREKPGRRGATAEVADDGRTWRRAEVNLPGYIIGAGECRPGEKGKVSPERKRLAGEIKDLIKAWHPDRNPSLDPGLVVARLNELRRRMLEA